MNIYLSCKYIYIYICVYIYIYYIYNNNDMTLMSTLLNITKAVSGYTYIYAYVSIVNT